MYDIHVEFAMGQPHDGGREDLDRAREAALTVLNWHGNNHVSYMDSYKEYCAQLDEGRSHEQTKGIAMIWTTALDAAQSALTYGWANPGNAFVTMYPVNKNTSRTGQTKTA
jgi:hypothetical protein